MTKTTTLNDVEREDLAQEMDAIALELAVLLTRMTNLESEYPHLRTFHSFTTITDQISERGAEMSEWADYVRHATDEPWREGTPLTLRATNPQDGKVPH